MYTLTSSGVLSRPRFACPESRLTVHGKKVYLKYLTQNFLPQNLHPLESPEKKVQMQKNIDKIRSLLAEAVALLAEIEYNNRHQMQFDYSSSIDNEVQNKETNS
jgi:hypothetical protein